MNVGKQASKGTWTGPQLCAANLPAPMKILHSASRYGAPSRSLESRTY